MKLLLAFLVGLLAGASITARRQPAPAAQGSLRAPESLRVAAWASTAAVFARLADDRLAEIHRLEGIARCSS